MKITKKINGIFKEIEITSEMEEFQTLNNHEKSEVLEKEYGVIERINGTETQIFINEDNEEEEKEVEILKSDIEILEELFLKKEKQEKLQNIKIETAGKIYGKYSKETQTTLLYKTLFLFIGKMLEDKEIKAKFSKTELGLFSKSKDIFLDMQKDIREYEAKKDNILKDN